MVNKTRHNKHQRATCLKNVLEKLYALYVYACHVFSLHEKTSNSAMMQNEEKMLQKHCFSTNTFLLFKNRKHTNSHMSECLQFFS